MLRCGTGGDLSEDEATEARQRVRRRPAETDNPPQVPYELIHGDAVDVLVQPSR